MTIDHQGPVPWAITHVAETGSTNVDLAAAAQGGAPHGTVLVADCQRQGRGRLGRAWVAPPGTALLFSALLRMPRVPIARCGWTGAILGLAVIDAVHDSVGLEADLKWPNDVLIGGRKVAGILAERVGDAVVVGVGINIDSETGDLPRADATSLLLSGGDPSRCDRDALLDAVLLRFGRLIERWQAADGDIDSSGLRTEYLKHCASVGSTVTVHLPDGTIVLGSAIDVAADGSIVVDDGHRVRHFSAGDVQHLRRAGISITEM